MTFDEILAQVIDLLKRQGRLSYRALKLRFDLDDDYIEGLKDELIYAQQLAVDEDNRVLVWSGATEGTSVSASQPTQTSEQPAIQQAQPTQATAPFTEPPTPDAERRQLTVMFCDLADSTKLSGQLDPEDLRDVIRAYQSTSTEVIERYDGYIAQHLGDGLMIYFGWPQAHEDDARRAVHAGLGILEAMQGLNTRLEQEKGVRLAVRVGIHTGLVVIGEIGKGASQEHLALGETPNIASRIEGIAEPATIAISAATYQLVQGYFVCEDLGLHTLKGVDEPQQMYRVVRESDAQSRLDVAATRGLTPLVGRESETTLLLERWEQVKDGQGQVVLLSGEAGIGKSRLVQVLRDHVVDAPHTRLECRSSPYYQNTALYPIMDLLQRTLQWQPDDEPQERLEKLERMLQPYRLPIEESVPLFATLLSLPVSEAQYAPLNLTPQQQRQKTLETIVAMVLEQAERHPVLFILEDLHWTDPSTLELLDLLIEQTPTSAIFTLLTCRPAFQPAWRRHSYLTPMTLNRLARSQIERMAKQVAGGKQLPAQVLEQIVEKTDGVPLFVEEMVKAVVESGALREADGQYELVGTLSALAIPVTLQDSLTARLDRLVTAKAVAQYASVIGRQFSYALLQAVSQLDEAVLQPGLGRLVEAELVYQRGLPPHATYTFKHALVQDAAYQSLLRRTRQDYHQRIAQALKAQFPETVETRPELLAHHYTEAGHAQEAVGYWQQAGQRASEHSALQEAINHLTKGLELFETLPSKTPEHLQQELDMLITLGAALMSTKGRSAPEVQQVYTRAQALCQQVGETPQLFTVLWGLWRFHLNRGAMQPARELGEQLLTLAQRQYNPTRCMVAHQSLGITLSYMGDLVPARTHLEQSITLCDPEEQWTLAVLYGTAPIVFCRAQMTQTLWALGYPDQALQRSDEACKLAQELEHPHSLVVAIFFAARLYNLCREVSAAQKRAEAAITLSTEQGFALWVAQSTIQRDWAQVVRGQNEADAVRMGQNIAATLARGQEQGRPSYSVHLAEAYARVERVDEGLRQLAEALAAAQESGNRFYASEAHRLQGELLLKQAIPDAPHAETCFQQALDIARQQQAKSWELRAATSLARLWQSQDKRQEAVDLLAPVYEWFTEGFDTADLKDARALLAELSENR